MSARTVHLLLWRFLRVSPTAHAHCVLRSFGSGARSDGLRSGACLTISWNVAGHISLTACVAVFPLWDKPPVRNQLTILPMHRPPMHSQLTTLPLHRFFL